MAVLVYCDREAFYVLGAPRKALRDFQETEIDLALEAVSRLMDGYLAPPFVLPIMQENGVLKLQCAAITAYSLLSPKGLNPENPADKSMQDKYDGAIAWLKSVRDKSVLPQLVDSSSAGVPGRSSAGRPVLYTGTDRGYTDRQGDVYGPGFNLGD